MKKVLEVIVNGESFPCFPTMGAMLRFKEKTGREVTEIKGHEISMVCIYLWCVVKSACERQKRKFDYTVQDFLDAIDSETMSEWHNSLERDSGEDSEKKSPLL